MGLSKGFVQVYTGDGKGKTTAALGLALRAAGAGLKVRIIQFMKGQIYAELKALAKFEGQIEVNQTGGLKCIRQEEVTDSDRQEAKKGLDLAYRTMSEADVDLLILDEILVAQWFDLVEETAILDLIDKKPKNLELILTGRRATERVMEKADLVTEMKEIKHYYQQGVKARKG
ncbi:cob(I)yrinic acid a,c-diamide adenosyltransferase, partial [bacterium]|nr:cob(I)yrinic acid a,c-diamide adenosyltransferase [bacterium]